MTETYLILLPDGSLYGAERNTEDDWSLTGNRPDGVYVYDSSELASEISEISEIARRSELPVPGQYL